MNPLHERIRRLPPGVEFLVVVSFAFGLPIFTSIVSLGTGGRAATGGALVYDDAALLNILVFELLQSAFLVWFLRVRGWTLAKFGLSINWRGAGMGWLLLVADVRLLSAYYVLVWAIGVVQIGYVVPLWRLLARRGLARTAKGLLIAAALTALANAVVAVVVFRR